MAAEYKVTYFDAKGTGEPLRYILAYAGVEFEDIRVKQEDWPALKPTKQFGMLPTLQVNGKEVSQSISICRYLGKVFNLAGKDDWENLQLDSVIDCLTDIRAQFLKHVTHSDEKEKEELKKVFINETFPYYLEKFDAVIKENDGYIVGGKLTWGDLYISAIVPALLEFLGMKLDSAKYPNFSALIEKVNALPNIKTWNEKHKA